MGELTILDILIPFDEYAQIAQFFEKSQKPRPEHKILERLSSGLEGSISYWVLLFCTLPFYYSKDSFKI